MLWSINLLVHWNTV